MDLEMQNEIQRYFNIPSRIFRLQNSIKEAREDFYSRTFTSHSRFIDDEWTLVGYRVETQVLNLLSRIEGKERHIEILHEKRRYFDQFLSSLPEGDQRQLHLKYRSEKQYQIHRVEARAYEEIKEIEEAICHKYGFPVEHEEVSERSVDDVAAILGV